MIKAIWNNTVIAESDDTVVIEGNHYFPPKYIKQEFFKANETHTTCPWKGVASYYDIEVNDILLIKIQPGIILKCYR